MKIKKMSLPDGWYPKTKIDCKKQIELYIKNYGETKNKDPISAIVPHAGWFFSGQIAARTIYSLNLDEADIVILFGGHLRQSDPILYSDYNAFETPFGEITQDIELLFKILQNIKTNYTKVDTLEDNSTEVLLPFIKFFAPNTNILVFRSPPSKLAKILADTLAKEIKTLGLNPKFIASSDLTHYGPDYNFTPKQNTKKALEWVQKVNDKNFITHLENMEGDSAIEHAITNHSACSAGACASAIYSCSILGKTKGNLIDYYTSYKVYPKKSFVGYAGLIF